MLKDVTDLSGPWEPTPAGDLSKREFKIKDDDTSGNTWTMDRRRYADGCEYNPISPLLMGEAVKEADKWVAEFEEAKKKAQKLAQREREKRALREKRKRDKETADTPQNDAAQTPAQAPTEATKRTYGYHAFAFVDETKEERRDRVESLYSNHDKRSKAGREHDQLRADDARRCATLCAAYTRRHWMCGLTPATRSTRAAQRDESEAARRHRRSRVAT
jgi:hypothetical protein